MAKNNPDPNEWVTNESRGPNIIRKKKIGGKGESSIYEWGLPPDKIPGNRPNIPWTKAAEEALGLEYDPNQAKALQKLLIEKLQVRLNEVKDTFFKHRDLKGGKNKIAQLLKETDFDASQIFKHKNTESKAIRRALASMFSTDANFFAEKGVWNLLKTDLSRLEGEELFKVVKGLDASLSGEKGGLVGHHTTLSAVTNVMDKVDEKWRVEFNKLAKEDGWRIGERGLERIQPVTHKPFDTKKGFPNIRMVKGDLAKKLAPLMPNAVFNKDTLEIVKGQHPKIDAFLDKMAEISTHGTGYGGTVGFSLDANLAQLTPQNAYNNARNIFAAEEVIQNQGKRLNVKLNKALRNFNFTNIDEAADFLLSKANQKDWQPAPIKSNLIAEARNELDPMLGPGNDLRAYEDFKKSQITLVDAAKDVSEDVLDRYSPPRTVDTPNNHLFRSKLKSILTPRNITKAGVLKTITSVPKSFAHSAADLVDLGIPSKETVEAEEFWPAYREELFGKGQALGTALAGFKILSSLPFVKGAVTKAGGVAANPYVGIPLTTVSILNQLDETYADGKGKQLLRDAKKGERLTTVKGDDTLVESMLSREQGTGAVWDEENQKWQEYTIPSIKDY